MSHLTAASLPDFSSLTVNVIGDAMLDEYLAGAVDRISPESPVPVVRVEERFSRPGGAANVAANCAALGARVRLGSVVGKDEAGRELIALCRDRGVDVSGVVELEGKATVRKLRVLGRGHQVARLDWDDNRPVEPQVVQRVLDLLGSPSAVPGVWLVSDYAKGLFNTSTCAQVMQAAAAAKRPVVVDPKVRDFSLYRGATVLTPNQRELHLAAGREPERTHDLDELAADARRLLAQCGAQALLVTRGEAGLSVFSARGEPVHLPAHRRQVYDTTGAGDTVAAVTGMMLGLGTSLVAAAAWANLAAGLVVERLGTATLSINELRAAVGGGVLLSREEAGRQVEAWRRAGLRVVFTNGCFDLLHRGHVHLLRAAAERGDKLVVGLNSDASVARLKGPGRPVLPAADRAAMLEAVAGVDAVTVFDEDTPLALVQLLRPHVLVKGADYTKDRVVGAAEVESWGGEVVLVPVLGDHSSSQMVASIRSGG